MLLNPALIRTLVGSLAVLALASVLVGCGGGSNGPIWAYSDDGDYLPRASSGGLVVDPDSPIPDVPMPVGFVAVPSKSSVSYDGVNRIVSHVYQGRSNTQDASAFYRQNLDDQGWRPTGMDTGDPRTPLQTYTKGPEELRISITETRSIVTILVTIAPKGFEVAPTRIQPPTPAPAPAPGSPPAS
jgi:hypothetical protein